MPREEKIDVGYVGIYKEKAKLGNVKVQLIFDAKKEHNDRFILSFDYKYASYNFCENFYQRALNLCGEGDNNFYIHNVYIKSLEMANILIRANNLKKGLM